MRVIKQTIMILGFCILAVNTGRGQDQVAALKIPNSPRGFLFNLHSPSWGAASANTAPRGIEGLQTVLARRFKVAQGQGVVTITLFDALVCRAHRVKGGESGSSVMIFRELPFAYPAGTSVLVPAGPMRLADLTEKTFYSPSRARPTLVRRP